MKITKKYLQKLIKEAVSKILKEGPMDDEFNDLDAEIDNYDDDKPAKRTAVRPQAKPIPKRKIKPTAVVKRKVKPAAAPTPTPAQKPAQKRRLARTQVSKATLQGFTVSNYRRKGGKWVADLLNPEGEVVATGSANSRVFAGARAKARYVHSLRSKR